MFEENHQAPKEQGVQQDPGMACSKEGECESDKKLVSITEAAKIHRVTRQAIYVAIKQKKLKARKEATRWVVDLDDLEEYRRNKYSRANSRYEGELLFDNSKGCYSVKQVAQMLGVHVQKIYYATRVGLLNASRKGSAWVIHIGDVEAYKQDYLERKAASLPSHQLAG